MICPENPPPHRTGLWVTLALVFLAHFLTQPAVECPGDAVAVRIESITVLNEGKLRVPAELASRFGERGQYFYENSEQGQWYSKYGIMNTLAYIPPLLVEKAWNGELPYKNPKRVIFLNIYNILLTTAAAAYLYLLATGFSRSAASCALFVLACLYATFWWNHTRIQAFEAYTPLLLIASTFHFWKATAGEEFSRWHLSLAAIFMGLLILSKSVYVILPPIFVTVAIARDYSRFRTLLKKFGENLGRLVTYYGIFLAGFLLILLLFNHNKFGSIFHTGYEQWARETNPMSGNVASGLFGYLFDFQYSVFLTFPVLLVACFGWRRFLQRYPWQGALILLISAALFFTSAKFLNWAGHWSYGPRYLLPVLPLLCLPFLIVLDRLGGKLKEKVSADSLAAATLVACLLLGSIFLQTKLNSIPFFAFYMVKDSLIDKINDPELNAYFATRPYPIISGDLINIRNDRPPLWYSFTVLKRVPAPERKRLKEAIDRWTVSNYYFFPSPTRP